MRRFLLALAAGPLLAVAACGTATTPHASPMTAPGTAAPAAATPSALAETRALCEAVGQVYTANMGPFAQALTELAAARERSGDTTTLQSRAQQRLGAFATAIRGATRAGGIGAAEAAGRRTADLLAAKSADAAFFGKIKTGEDAENVLGPTLKKWLEPVTDYCS